MKITQEWVNVSHSIGAPFGGLGTGYGVLGRFGFVLPNFDSIPCEGKYKTFNELKNYDYLNLHGNDRKNFMSLVLTVDGSNCVFQKEALCETGDDYADVFTSYEFLPFALHTAEFEKHEITLEMLTYSPIIPYDVSESSIPVLCMEIKVRNNSSRRMECGLQFRFGDINILSQNMKVVFEDNTEKCLMQLEAGEEKSINGFFAWYYPEFNTPSAVLTEDFIRYYTLRFKDVGSVTDYAVNNYKKWKSKMKEWQNSLDFPAPFKRMWFSSLSSVITSTMMSTDPYFFEIETPHPYINTMDVTIYSSWIYMINWPELEKADMYQYREKIPTSGEDKGLIWHSLWSDRADYVEEPCFVTRIYRDYLWYNDKKFLNDMSETVKNALNRVYEQKEYDSLIESKHGNQSYDRWKMPGISAYANMPWLYALYSVSKINKIIGSDIKLKNKTVEEVLKNAMNNFVKYLWNSEKEYFNCFYRTENAKDLSIPESIFTDQMFGRWLMLIERGMDDILPIDMIKKSLKYVYKNNLIDDKKNNFRGWSNGRLPDGGPCCDSKQYHVKTCWMGAQLNLGSVIGELGFEEESLDVFYSIEKSLGNNHLAVGEWNKSIIETGMSSVLTEEVSKDTPRFPSYPRYKSCWEYLVRLLGLKLDEKYIELRPFSNIDFSIKDILLAGCRVCIKVNKGWSKIYVDGKLCKNAVFDRNGEHEITFV